MTVNRMILNETSYFGKGAIENIVPEIETRGFKKVVVVTDKGLIDFKVATKVTEMLDQANVSYDIYDGIVPNPTVQNVKDGVAFVEASKAVEDRRSIRPKRSASL